jgi:hypothetical protein
MTERDSEETRTEDTGDASAEQPERPKRFDKRVEEWLLGLQDEAKQAAPQVLDELSATAKSVAQYLDDLADKARRKQKDASEQEPSEDSGSSPPEIDSSRPPD